MNTNTSRDPVITVLRSRVPDSLESNTIHQPARSTKRPRPPASSFVRLTEPPSGHTREGYEGSSSAGES